MKRAPIPKDFLKRRERWFKTNLLDVVTLLYHVYEGDAAPDVGFEDAKESIQSLSNRLTKKKIWIDPSVLESALWSCNLMDEKGLFKDVKGRSFEEFVKHILKGAKFNRFYNCIERSDK